jgi:hypothetical protein
MQADGPPSSEIETWLDQLSDSHVQACGHIRLMITNYADYGLPSDFVPRAGVQAFYHEMWDASISDKQKYAFQVRLGTLNGKALAVISNGGPACSGYSPAVMPNNFASQVFVYHSDSVDAFRKKVLAPFFVSQHSTLTSTTFHNFLNALQNVHLFATLTSLAPANQVNQYSVAVNTSLHLALRPQFCP